MSQSTNWQNQIKLTGHHCYVAVRTLSDRVTWGRIGETQITKNGFCPPRAVFIKRKPRTFPQDYLFRLSVLKRSLTGTHLVPARPNSAGQMPTEHAHEVRRGRYCTKFFTKLMPCAGAEPGLYGGDIILGANHKFFSPMDQSDANEQNGHYKPQPPIPARYMVGTYGNLVPWLAPPLSDHRSLGNWVVRHSRFYIQDELDVESGDCSVPDEIIIRRVGRYHFV